MILALRSCMIRLLTLACSLLITVFSIAAAPSTATPFLVDADDVGLLSFSDNSATVLVTGGTISDPFDFAAFTDSCTASCITNGFVPLSFLFDFSDTSQPFVNETLDFLLQLNIPNFGAVDLALSVGLGSNATSQFIELLQNPPATVSDVPLVTVDANGGLIDVFFTQLGIFTSGDFPDSLTRDWGVQVVLRNPSAAEIPEPGTLVIFGLGLLAIGAARWRKNVLYEQIQAPVQKSPLWVKSRH